MQKHQAAKPLSISDLLIQTDKLAFKINNTLVIGETPQELLQAALQAVYAARAILAQANAIEQLGK